MYIKRHAEKTIERLSKMFGPVLVAGPQNHICVRKIVAKSLY